MPAVLTTASPAEILPHALYKLDELMARIGWGRAAMREARRRCPGLVRYAGGRAFVLGKDFIAYIEQHGTPSEAADQADESG